MKIAMSLVFTLYASLLNAQLIIENNSKTPEQLIKTVLTGEGVTPFNIKFNRSPNLALQINPQVGEFKTGLTPTNIGLDKGLILSTGIAKNAEGPNNSNEFSSSFDTIDFISEDEDLRMLSQMKIKRVAIIEFDFVATGPSLKFDFVFASEEYPEFVDEVNDSFGFFLSGPGINGNFSNNAKNIALVPHTNIPISINTVNNGKTNTGQCKNCNYYYNNSLIGMDPTIWNPNSTTQYDGLTKNLYAEAQLLCGETYHIKIAIGNAFDDRLDSCVFLKNFTIAPLVLVDQDGNDTVNGCEGVYRIISGYNSGNYIFEWKKNGVKIDNINKPEIEVNSVGTYELKIFNTNGCLVAQDEILVNFSPLNTKAPIDLIKCNVGSSNSIFNLNQNELMLNGASSNDFFITYRKGTATGQIIPNSELSSFSSSHPEIEIWVEITHKTKKYCAKNYSFKVKNSNNQGSFKYQNTPFCSRTNSKQFPVLSNLNALGTFTSSPEGLNIDAKSGIIIPNLSVSGKTYTIKYNIPPTATCPAFSVETEIKILEDINLMGNFTACIGTTKTLSGSTTPNPSMAWLSSNPEVATIDNNGKIIAYSKGTTLITYMDSNGCNKIEKFTVEDLPTIQGNLKVCKNGTSQLTVSGVVSIGSIWSSSNTSVASINNTGLVQGISSGEAIITFTNANGCSVDVTINVIEIPSAPIINQSYVYCEKETNISNLSAIGTNLLWYTQESGGIGSITAPTPDTSQIGVKNYYVSQIIGLCESDRAKVTVTIIDNPKPKLNAGNICLDAQGKPLNGVLLNAGLSVTNFDFKWFNTTTNPPTLVGDNNATFYTTIPGNYRVIATAKNSPFCESNPFDSNANTIVTSSFTPISFKTEISNSFGDSSALTVYEVIPERNDNYEYQLDNNGFQKNNVFKNLDSGEHTIQVRDVNGCGILSETIFILDYPKFFTPNGDGYNDTWNIKLNTDKIKDSFIRIFDQYGKLIKELNPLSSGWDGNFNGRQLPATDYWFVLSYNEKGELKEFKRNFSLKR